MPYIENGQWKDCTCVEFDTSRCECKCHIASGILSPTLTLEQRVERLEKQVFPLEF